VYIQGTATSTPTEIEEPKEAWMTDEDAVKAAQDVIRKKELEKESIELKAQIEELQAKKIIVDKELGTF
jgi:hypothetical protein